MQSEHDPHDIDSVPAPPPQALVAVAVIWHNPENPPGGVHTVCGVLVGLNVPPQNEDQFQEVEPLVAVAFNVIPVAQVPLTCVIITDDGFWFAVIDLVPGLLDPHAFVAVAETWHAPTYPGGGVQVVVEVFWGLNVPPQAELQPQLDGLFDAVADRMTPTPPHASVGPSTTGADGGPGRHWQFTVNCPVTPPQPLVAVAVNRHDPVNPSGAVQTV